jgi:EAL domain-containing protein (putative c-di-GMP-specific phosphodiesterase class I)
VVAEGVETETELDYLRSHRCDEVQGHLLAEPMSVEACETFLRRLAPGSKIESAEWAI